MGITEDEYECVLAAGNSKDVDVKLRNKLYLKLNRIMGRANVPEGMIKRWADDKGSWNSQFKFLQEWVSSGGEWGVMKLSEEITRTGRRNIQNCTPLASI